MLLASISAACLFKENIRSEDAIIGGGNDSGLWWSQKAYLDAVLPTGPETVLSLMAGNFSIYLVTGQQNPVRGELRYAASDRFLHRRHPYLFCPGSW
jgi:hypothetical protein